MLREKKLKLCPETFQYIFAECLQLDEVVIFLPDVPVLLPCLLLRGGRKSFFIFFFYNSHFSGVPVMNPKLTAAEDSLWQDSRGRKKRLRHLGAKRTRQGWRMNHAGCPLYPSPVLFPSRHLGTFQPTTKMPPKIKRIGINSLRRSKKKKIPPASGKRFDLHQLAFVPKCQPMLA